jgi:plasmid stabilization system protein ParE
VIDYSIEITPLAERVIADGFAWYFSRNPIAADTFRTLVFDAFAMISHSPLSWAKGSERGVMQQHFFARHGAFVAVSEGELQAMLQAFAADVGCKLEIPRICGADCLTQRWQAG